MSEEGWVTLLEVFDRLTAEIIKSAIEAQGIPAQLFQEGASHYIYPVNGPMGKIEICVPNERLVEAQTWLDAYNKGEYSIDSSEISETDNE